MARAATTARSPRLFLAKVAGGWGIASANDSRHAIPKFVKEPQGGAPASSSAGYTSAHDHSPGFLEKEEFDITWDDIHHDRWNPHPDTILLLGQL
jgi:hypothetical protein